MTGDIDLFPFILAQDLGMYLHQIDEMPYEDYVAWRAYYVYKNAMEDHAMEVARMKR